MPQGERQDDKDTGRQAEADRHTNTYTDAGRQAGRQACRATDGQVAGW